jgi:hypothetical protein
MRTHKTDNSDNDWLQIVRRHIEPLQYGSVEIVIHDSRIVQIDKTERWRMPKTPNAQSPEASKATRRVSS